METLIRRLCAGLLDRAGERDLYGQHTQHFGRRVRVLDRAFFPGREKSPQGIGSLANGAYASFQNEPIYDGTPAFEQVVQQAHPAKGYLYFWRASATIKFLEHDASPELRARLNLLRNVRIHLREAFDEVGVTCGESLWSWKGASLGARVGRPDLDRIQPKLDGLRGKPAVKAVIEAAGVPLTRNEIAAVLERRLGLGATDPVGGIDVEMRASDDHESMEDRTAEEQLAPRVTRFVESIETDTLRLLHARGYATGGPYRSLRAVAEELGRAEETLRRREKRVFERFRKVFDEPAEAEIAAKLFVAALSDREV